MTVKEIIETELNIPVLDEPVPLMPACATCIDYYTGRWYLWVAKVQNQTESM